MIYVRSESMNEIADYARMSCAFQVASVLDVAQLSSQQQLIESSIDVPYVKDYDALPGNQPTAWSTQFDTTSWQLFAAFLDGVRVGGAIAFPTDASARVPVLFAELWDLRVSPSCRGRGVGSALFGAVEHWCGERHVRSLHIETQHVNVSACRFYRARGCVVDSITPKAYTTLPHEVRIGWRRDF